MVKDSRFISSLPAVRGVEVYDSTIVVKRHRRDSNHGRGVRGEITELSSSSLGRLAFVAFNTPAYFASMITLTYPGKFPGDGRDIKVHLDRFLKWYRRTYPDELYLWWLEFQRRGAPHFHILTTVNLASLGTLSTITRKSGKKWQTHYPAWRQMRETWAKLGGGLTAWEVINDQEGGKKYAAKYATKAYQKKVPKAFQNVGRFWGHSRDGVKPEIKTAYLCDETTLRQALERGGWEYLPDDGGLLYRELFQASKFLDVGSLANSADLDADYLSHEDLVYGETGLYPLLVLRNEHVKASEKLLSQSSCYCCLNCGVESVVWSGQCSSCGEWHSLKRIDTE